MILIMITFLGLTVLYNVVFSLKRGARFKRRWHPWFTGFLYVFLLIGAIFVETMHFPVSRTFLILAVIFWIVPLFTFTAYSMIRDTTFCDACGFTVNWRENRDCWTYCYECGSTLAAMSKPPFWSLTFWLSRYRYCPSCRLRTQGVPHRGRPFRRPRYRFCPACGMPLTATLKPVKAAKGHDDLLD